MLVAILAALLPLSGPAAADSDSLQDYLRVRELMSDGRYDRAMELAARLAEQERSGLFLDLPRQVLAERSLRQGDARAALALYQQVTPPGCCRVTYIPEYWNSCQRMAELFGRLGDRPGRIDMLRRLSFGAGLRAGSSAPEALFELAVVYEEAGDLEQAQAFFQAVVHGFDAARPRRRSIESLDRHGLPIGDPDDVILSHALSHDPVLERAGMQALSRLADPERALERLLDEAAAPHGREPALEVLVRLPLPDLDARLRDLLWSDDGFERELAQQTLRRRTGLSYPYLDADGEVHAEFDDSSPFHGVWGTAYLTERMDDPYESERVRLMALDAIGRTADLRGMEPILRHVANPSPLWRVHAVHALRGYRGDLAEEALVERLADPDPLVRLFAAAGIARRPLADAAELLAAAVATEEDPLVAAALAEALGALPGEDGPRRLADLSRRLRGLPAAAAGDALRRRGVARGTELLEEVARGPEPGALWARRSLGTPRIAGSPPTPLLDRLVPDLPVPPPPPMPGPDSPPEEIFAAALLGIPPPEAPIVELLESSRWSDYRGAALALANTGVRSHLNVIRRRARQVEYRSDGSTVVRYDEELIEVLGILQDDAAIPLLREVLRSETRGGARVAAARALGMLGDLESAPLLLALFSDPGNPDRLRRTAARALARLDARELAPLILGGLESADPELRRWTLLLLRDTGSPLGAEEVATVAESDPEAGVRELAGTVAAVLAGHP